MHKHNLTPTATILPVLIAQMARVAVLCQACGVIGTIYANDHVTLLCGRCWLVVHGVTPNDKGA